MYFSGAIDDYQDMLMTLAKFFACNMELCYYFTMVNVFSYSYSREPETYKAFNPWLNKTSIYGKYPFETYVPFDTSISDGHYFMGKVYQLYLYFGNISMFLGEKIFVGEFNFYGVL